VIASCHFSFHSGSATRRPGDAGLIQRFLQFLQIDLDQFPQSWQLLGELLRGNAVRLTLASASGPEATAGAALRALADALPWIDIWRVLVPDA